MIVELWMDDRRVGCGLRRYVVLQVGRKWVRLFHAPTLQTIPMPKSEFERHARPAVGAKPKAVRRIIRANVQQAQRLGLWDGGKAAKEALRAL